MVSDRSFDSVNHVLLYSLSGQRPAVVHQFVAGGRGRCVGVGGDVSCHAYVSDSTDQKRNTVTARKITIDGNRFTFPLRQPSAAWNSLPNLGLILAHDGYIHLLRS